MVWWKLSFLFALLEWLLLTVWPLKTETDHSTACGTKAENILALLSGADVLQKLQRQNLQHWYTAYAVCMLLLSSCDPVPSKNQYSLLFMTSRVQTPLMMHRKPGLGQWLSNSGVWATDDHARWGGVFISISHIVRMQDIKKTKQKGITTFKKKVRERENVFPNEEERMLWEHEKGNVLEFKWSKIQQFHREPVKLNVPYKCLF